MTAEQFFIALMVASCLLAIWGADANWREDNGL